MLEYLCNIILILLATVGAAFLVVTALDWLLAKKPDGGQVPADPSKLSDGYYGYQPKTDSKTPTQPPDVGTTAVTSENHFEDYTNFNYVEAPRGFVGWHIEYPLISVDRIVDEKGVEYVRDHQIHDEFVFVAVKKAAPNKNKPVRKTDNPKPKRIRRIVSAP